MVQMRELHELIREDAESVRDREDVDSIDLVDNVRYHLSASSMAEAQDKLEIIESLLTYLNLDAWANTNGANSKLADSWNCSTVNILKTCLCSVRLRAPSFVFVTVAM